jgi:hypothetical protein
VGALLALVGLGAALLAAARALRSVDPLVRVVAGAALAGFGYWLVHGSFDWFWEFAGLGAPAFALLGIACALAPPRAQSSERALSGGGRVPRSPRRLAAIAASLTVALAAAVSLAAPWLSQLEVQSATRIWTTAPQSAYARLHDATRLNPLSDEADLLAGSIALRYGDLSRADREFSMALARNAGDAYATLERGAIASASGDRNAALELLTRLRRLTPREPLAGQVLALVRDGKRVNIDELNRLILLKGEQLE